METKSQIYGEKLKGGAPGTRWKEGFDFAIRILAKKELSHGYILNSESGAVSRLQVFNISNIYPPCALGRFGHQIEILRKKQDCAFCSIP